MIVTQKKEKELFLASFIKRWLLFFLASIIVFMEKGGTAYCLDCESFFSHEKRDIFDGEVYCPKCSGRAWKRYRNMSEAKKDTKIKIKDA